MSISGMDYPDQAANNHLTEPRYTQRVDALLYFQNKRIVLPEQEDDVYSPYEADGYEASALLPLALSPKELCPDTGNPSNHVSSHA